RPRRRSCSTLFPYTTLFRSLTREVVYRYRDQAIGEVRRPIFVTRDVDVAIAPDELLWPIDGGSREPRHFTVTVTNRACGPATVRSEEHTSELQSRFDLVCRL